MVGYLLLLALINADFDIPAQIAALEKQAFENPADLQSRLQLARIFLDQENYIEAKKNLVQAEAIDSFSAQTQFLWGKFYDQRDNIALALTKYAAAVGLDSTQSEAWHAMGYIYEITADYSSMLNCFKKALLNASDSAGLYYDIGVTYDYLENPDSAIIVYHKSLDCGAAFPEVFTNLGADWGIIGNNDSAAYYFEKAVAAGSKSPELYYNLGMMAAEKSETEKAIADFIECLNNDPSFAPAKMQLGNLFELLGDSAKALVYFREFVRTAPIIYLDDIKATREKLAKYDSR